MVCFAFLIVILIGSVVPVGSGVELPQVEERARAFQNVNGNSHKFQ